MLNVEDRIKKIVEKHSNINLKSIKDRSKLINELIKLVESSPKEPVVVGVLGEMDMFELKQNNTIIETSFSISGDTLIIDPLFTDLNAETDYNLNYLVKMKFINRK